MDPIALCVPLVYALALMLAGLNRDLRPNPVAAVVIAWTPAMLLSLLPVNFIHPIYTVLNGGVSPAAHLIIALGLLAFSLGVLAHQDVMRHRPAGSPAPAIRLSRLTLTMGLGLAVYVYALYKSGLISCVLRRAPAEEISASRLAFHVGSMNHLVLLLDITAIVFFARFLDTGRKLLLVPVILSLIAYGITLQKSRVMFIVFSLLFVAALHQGSLYKFLFGTHRRKILALGSMLALGGLLLFSNRIRGVGAERYTDLPSRLSEQVFIYSGAPALRNLSATLDGSIRSDAPTYGTLLIRTFLWPVVRDRDTLSPTGHLEGINNGTALLYYWHDFGVPGVLGGCFMAGLIISISFRLAQTRSVFGLVAGCMAFYAAIMSVFTEVIFEPSTFIILCLAAGLDLLTRARPQVARIPPMPPGDYHAR